MNRFEHRPDGTVAVNGAVIEGATDIVVGDIQYPGATRITLSFMADSVSIQKGPAHDPEDDD